jgi:hypothetical protein
MISKIGYWSKFNGLRWIHFFPLAMIAIFFIYLFIGAIRSEVRDVDVQIPKLIPKSYVELTDLISIVEALTKYRNDNKQYPISSKNGKGFDGLYSNYGESKVNWIEGLVPKYIKNLPRDPRNLTEGHVQYIYSSDGANFKLIALNPLNCKEVALEYAALVDPMRVCQAYGFWTPAATYWIASPHSLLND